MTTHASVLHALLPTRSMRLSDGISEGGAGKWEQRVASLVSASSQDLKKALFLACAHALRWDTMGQVEDGAGGVVSRLLMITDDGVLVHLPHTSDASLNHIFAQVRARFARLVCSYGPGKEAGSCGQAGQGHFAPVRAPVPHMPREPSSSLTGTTDCGRSKLVPDRPLTGDSVDCVNPVEIQFRCGHRLASLL